MKITIVLAAVLACAFAAPNKYIIGGAPAEITDFPYLVSVQWGKFNTYYHICGGAILDANRVITAKHCCKFDSSELFVLANSGNVKVKEENIASLDFHSVTNVIGLDPLLRKPKIEEADLCILELEKPLIDFKSVKIEKITQDPNAKLQLAGWGYKEFGISEMSEEELLQSTNIEIKTHEECKDIIIKLGIEEDIFHDDNFCTMHDEDGKSKAQTVCNGDSGGPLVEVVVNAGENEYNLIGVVSWGIVPCGARGIPSIFTDVFQYKNVIEKDSRTVEENLITY